jgi:hypothetical protein
MRTVSSLAAGALALAAFPSAAQDWDALRDMLFATADELFAGEGFHPVGFLHEGSLNGGESERVTVSLAPGEEIALVGVCDSDCSDLDMTLLDPDGEQVADDLQGDDVPIVLVTPTRTGSYAVSVRMAACSADPCRNAIQMFAR